MNSVLNGWYYYTWVSMGDIVDVLHFDNIIDNFKTMGDIIYV